MSDPRKQIARDFGCGDNSCMFGSPGGMATNGGCRCLQAMPHDAEARTAQRKVRGGVAALARALDEAAKRLHAAEEEMEAHCQFGPCGARHALRTGER